MPEPIAGRLEQVAAIYAAGTGAHVTILDPRGNVIADSIDPFGSAPNQLNQPEVRAALNGLVQRDVRVAPASGETALFVAAPIQQGDRILGLVQMTRPMQQITEGFRRFVLQLGGISLFALILVTLLGIAISRRLVRPVQALEQASLRVAGGDLSQQVPVETADELGALGNAFNRVDKARSRTEPLPDSRGVGLGLAIVRALLEQNRGHIAVESQPGQGTIFTVELPFSH